MDFREISTDFSNLGISGDFNTQVGSRSKSYLGRFWDYVRPTSVPDGVKKTTALFSFAASGALAYLGARSFQTSGINIQNACLFGGTSGAAFGLGLSLTNPLQKPRDTVNSWSYELYQALTQIYINNGWPRDEGGWKKTDAIRYGFASGFSFLSAYFITQTVNHITQAPYDEDFLPNIDHNTGEVVFGLTDGSPIDIEEHRPLSLFLESGSSFSVQFFVEQAIKVALGAGVIAAYYYAPQVINSPELFNLGAFLATTAPGAIFSIIWNIFREKIINENKDGISHQETGIQIPDKILWLRRAEKVAELMSHAVLGVAFAFKSPFAFSALGFVSGWRKIINLREFEQIKPHKGKGPITIENIFQPALDFCEKKCPEIIVPFMKLAALGCAIGWYAFGLSEQGETVKDKTKVALYFCSALAAYLSTRAAAKHFSPQESSSFVNSLYFYLVHHTSNSILPYALIRSVQPITNHVHSNVFKELLSFFAFGFLGFAAGQNRAEQGLKSHRIHTRPGPVSEYYASFLLANIGQGEFV